MTTFKQGDLIEYAYKFFYVIGNPIGIILQVNSRSTQVYSFRTHETIIISNRDLEKSYRKLSLDPLKSFNKR